MTGNLLVNGDAETGDLTGWTDASGNGYSVTTSEFFDGTHSFHGGLNGSSGPRVNDIHQDIDVCCASCPIDAGRVTAHFEGRGYSSSDGSLTDYARFVVEFLPGGTSYDSGDISPVNEWVHVTAALPVPVGTRTIRVHLISRRSGGASTDAFHDAVSLTLDCTGNLLVNGDAEAGNLTGWTDASGNGFGVSTSTVFQGGFSFHGGTNGPSGPRTNEIYQDVNVSSYSAEIDAGLITAHFQGRGYSASAGGTDHARFIVEFLPGGTFFDSGNVSPPNSWVFVADHRQVPPGTTTIRVRLIADRSLGGSTDGYHDAISLNLDCVDCTRNRLINGDAEAGSLLSGWTDVSGNGYSVSASNVFQGSWSFHGGVNGPSGPRTNEISQDLDVSGSWCDIDAGLVRSHFRGRGYSASAAGGTDYARFVVEFLPGGTSFDSGNITPVNDWVLVTDDRVVPSGTHTIRVRLIAQRSSGASTDGYQDAVSLTLDCADPTSGMSDGDNVPKIDAISQNFPNPFRSETVISFRLPEAGPVKLDVFDVSGRVVKRLVEKPMAAGEHQMIWDGTDSAGRRLAQGSYVLRLRAGAWESRKKAILLR